MKEIKNIYDSLFKINSRCMHVKRQSIYQAAVCFQPIKTKQAQIGPDRPERLTAHYLIIS